jgi:DNA-binding NtrC family response regulator
MTAHSMAVPADVVAKGGGARAACEKVRIMLEKSPKLRVLIVDDESLIRWSMADTLVHAGWDVSEAASARETLQRLSADPAPDVILLDYRLPDSNDLKLLEMIRRAVPGSPVVMMTAYGTPAMQAGALELGAYRVVIKPLEMRDVVPLVRAAYDAGS